MNTSFESELFEVMGLESHLEYDCSVESDMIYDDNFIQYTEEMVGVAVLMTASESVIFSMESEDNIFVRFFKFIGNVIKKIIKGIINFIKWIGSSIKSIFVGPPKDYDVKIKQIKTMTKEEVDALVESKRLKGDVVVIDVQESKKIAESRATFYKQVSSNIDKNQQIIDDLSRDTKKNNDETSEALRKLREETEQKLQEFNLAEKKAAREKIISRREEGEDKHVGILSTEIISIHDYIKKIDNYDLSSNANSKYLKDIADIQDETTQQTRKRLEKLENSVDYLIKISEKLQSENVTRSANDIKKINTAVDVAHSTGALKEVKENINLMLKFLRESLNGNSKVMSEMLSCKKTSDKMYKVMIMVRDTGRGDVGFNEAELTDRTAIVRKKSSDRHDEYMKHSEDLIKSH